MKALKTKVILSGIVLVFAFIATIGTTFAWFTISTTATVESMELNVSAAENILVKPNVIIDSQVDETDGSYGASLTNPANYYTTLSNDHLIDAGYLYENRSGTFDPLDPEGDDFAYDTPWRLQPATIIESGYTGVDAKNLNYINNIDNEDRLLVEATPNSNGGHYIQLQFWLLSQAETVQYIELDNISITAENGGSNPGDLNEVVNATRLSVWLDDTAYAESEGDTGYTGVNGEAFVYGLDIDYDYEFLPSIAGYSNDPVTDLGLIDPAAPFNQLSDLDNNPVATLPANHFSGAAGPTNETVVSTQDLFEIQPGVPTLATVLIYIEGWDEEADNNIVKAQFSVGFTFTYGTQD
ncbi:MAG: hypothetical protein R6U15_02285 [Candidatus Izemoplasmatales bacterium]